MNDSDDCAELKSLDPGFEDPGFWIRAHGRVMAQARGELARRQMSGEWSISEVVFQWRKTLVPMTLLAAAMAGIFVLGYEEPASVLSPIALEEALMLGFEGDPIPTVLGRTAELDEVAFLAGAGGF
ncbi:MAG: hypothetical protein ABIF09_04565 [Gemmatimonadota bacterium]